MYYDNDSTLYIAGTKSASDLIADLTIPFGNLIESTPRFKQAEQMIRQNMKINRVVGHSLGSEISHHLVEKYSWLQGILYAHPTITFSNNPRIKSYRNYGDILSSGDFAAINRFSLNPHSYK